MIRVVLDAMGGDNAPFVPVSAAVEAVSEEPDIKVIITGKKEVIEKELSHYDYDHSRIDIVDTREVIITLISGSSETASTAALTGTKGALSPPMASSTTLIIAVSFVLKRNLQFNIQDITLKSKT